MERTESVSPIRAAKGQKRRRRYRCMFQDEKDRWWLDYYTPDGKRRRKLVGKSKREADALLAKLKLAKATGEYVDPANSPIFSEFCSTFMERHGQHRPSYGRSAHVLRKLKAFFGSIRLSRLAPGHIERYRLMRLSEKSRQDSGGPVSLTTIDREVEIIRAMLGKAVKWGFLAKNPASQVEDYNKDNRRERFLSSDEILRLLQATKRVDSPILRPVVYLALQTGMRKAEILGLRWPDINFEAGKLLVRETKSGEPRQVPMSRRARWLLHKLAARAPLSDYVFETTKRNGAKGSAGDIKTAWRHALRLARVESFRFHDLRHTFASHFAMKGGDLYALAEILGHSNPKITLDRYAHLSPEFIQAQRGIMDAMYSNRERNRHQMDTESIWARNNRS